MNRLDWLEQQLGQETLAPALRQKYELEAQRLAASITASQHKAVLLAKQHAERIAEIRKMYLSNNFDDVVDMFGIPEFGEDYEIIVEGESHVVYSKVAQPNQEARHPTSSQSEAQRRLRQLVWYRLYDKYVRSGQVDSLTQLAN
jgi:hypothetical protein